MAMGNGGPRPPGILLLLGSAGGLTALSWARFRATGALAPDYGTLPLVPGLLAVALVVALLLLALAGLRRAVRAAPPPAVVLPWAVLLTAVAAAMLPLLSNDLFSVLAYVDLAWRSPVNPFVLPPPGITDSRFCAYVSASWMGAPCVYGPLQMFVFFPALAAEGPLGAILLAKLPAAAATLAILGLLFLYARPRPHTWPAFALVALHPLLWVEGTGQVHTDLVAAACLAAWILAGSRGAVVLAGAALGLAVAAKLTALVPAGMYLVFLLARGDRPWRRRLGEGAAAGLALGAAVALCYVPFWAGPATVTRPLWFLSWKWPVNTWFEPVFRLLDQGGWPYWLATRTLGNISTSLTALLAAGGIVAAWRAADFAELVERAAIVSFLALTATATSFQPWYLLTPLVLAIEVRHPAWQRFVLVSGSLALLLDSSCLLERPSLVHEAWRLLCLPAVCALWADGLVARTRAVWERGPGPRR